MAIGKTNERVTKKPQIMAAALKLFVEKGINGTTIRDIAQEAGVAEGAMYRHFKSKDELARRLLSDNLKRLMNELKKKVRVNNATYEKIRAIVATILAFWQEEPLLCSYVFLAEHTELNKFIKEKTRPKEVLIKIIEEGKKAGILREIDSTLGAAMVIGIIHRIIIFKKIGFLQMGLSVLIDEITDSTWRILAINPNEKI